METSPNSEPVRIKRPLVWLVLAAWLLVTLVLGAFTTAAHSAALPRPNDGDATLGSALIGLRRDPSRPLAVHALYARCKCSQGIVEHLIARHSDARFEEVVLLVGDLPQQERLLAGSGYTVHHVQGAELETRFHIEAAPLLVVTDARGRVQYAGGYQKFKGGVSVEQSILDGAASGDALARLPVLGCAVSKRLRGKIDPLGLKESGED
ncbi:MAG: hypothetical protein QM756_02215 [Polyangiaceae bacterium]